MQLFKYVLCAELASALPQFAGQVEERSVKHYRPYVHWGPNDSRSPCPGLNALANHGYLRHDGRNISRDEIIVATREVFNFDDNLTIALNSANFDQLPGQPQSADLGDFGKPALTEHRGSLTRLDPEEPDYSVLPEDWLVDKVLADSKNRDHISVHSMAKSRLRIAEMTGETGGPLSKDESDVGSGTSSLILLTVPENLDWEWSPEFRPTAPKSWVETWLKEERLPVKEGWRTPGHVSTMEDLGKMITRIETQKAIITGSS